MLLFAIIIAPSCKGLFLKKILSNIGCVKVIFISSPVETKKSRLLLRSNTIKAPVLELPIFVHAATTMLESVSLPVWVFKKLKRL